MMTISEFTSQYKPFCYYVAIAATVCLLEACGGESVSSSAPNASTVPASSVTASSVGTSINSSAVGSSITEASSSADFSSVTDASAMSSRSASSSSNPGNMTEPKSYRVLTVRIEYADVPFTQELEAMDAGNAQVARYFSDNSYGNVELDFYHHPLIITMPDNREAYNSDEKWNAVYSYASQAILDAGYIQGTDYEFLLAFFPYTEVNWWGNYFGQTSKSAYLNMYNGDYQVHTTIHEMGHIFNLPHAGSLIAASNTDVIGDLSEGINVDFYGDDYDIMGSGSNGSAALNVEYKRRLGWVDSDDILNVTKSGTYRIYAHDTGVKPNGPLGIRIQTSVKNPTENTLFSGDAYYLLEYRVAERTTDKIDGVNARQGVSVRLMNQTREMTLLLDMTPNSQPIPVLEFTDSALDVGKKYIDELDGGLFSLETLSVNEGVWDHNGYVDVKIEFLK